jgi:hypothetical protein
MAANAEAIYPYRQVSRTKMSLMNPCIIGACQNFENDGRFLKILRTFTFDFKDFFNCKDHPGYAYDIRNRAQLSNRLMLP